MTAKEHDEKALLLKISELQEELRKVKKQKKYGLVWEDKPEQVVEDCKRNVPILRLKEKKKGFSPVITTDDSKDENILIEGDNYHALSVLNYTHKGKVDVIYIDPPYNTGNKDFIYNDRFIDTEDPFRHSKWVAFMEKRLRLARNLLKDSGAIFINIDDHEYVLLKMLCDEIFGEENFIANIIWQHSIQPKGYTNTFSVHHNYLLCYRKSDAFNLNALERTDEHNKNYSNPDNDPRGAWRSGDVRNALYRKNLIYDIKTPSGKIISPPSNGWRWSKETLAEKIKTGEIIFSKDETRIIRKIYLDTLEGRAAETIWFGKDVGTTREASQELKDIFGGDVRFETPKPTRLIKQVIKLHKNPNALILDFFAGSGTSGQAVLSLNNEDGGDRKFILCTNNGDEKSDHEIASGICYPRLAKVIQGYKNPSGENIEGLGGNLRYYKTDFVDVEKLYRTPDHAKVKLTYQAGEMIGLRENTLNEIEKNDWWQIFEGHGKTTAIYFKEDKEKLQDLISLLEKKKQSAVVYIFSWGKNEYKAEYSSTSIRVEDIPEPILEVYKEINRL